MRNSEPGPVPGLVAPRRRANGKLIRDGGERDLFFSKTVQLKILGLKQPMRTAHFNLGTSELGFELRFELLNLSISYSYHYLASTGYTCR